MEPTWLYEALSRFPAMGRFARRLPGRLRLKRASKPTWKRKTINYVKSMIIEDVQLFLAYCGRPAEFWNLDEAVVSC